VIIFADLPLDFSKKYYLDVHGQKIEHKRGQIRFNWLAAQRAINYTDFNSSMIEVKL
jgi:hypothetical protein